MTAMLHRTKKGENVMKRTMALVLTLVLSICLLSTGVAAAQKTPRNEIEETAQYLNGFLEKDVAYTDGRAVWLITQSGIDCKELTDSYFESVEAELKASGMLPTRYEDNGKQVEYDEPVNYAYAALVAKATDADAKDIDGVNLLERLESFGKETLLTGNPYSLTAILTVYEQFEDEMTIEGMENDIVKTLTGYCDPATGVFVLWGDASYCIADDNARMLMAIAPYSDVQEVSAVLDSGAQWLQSKKSDGGYLGYDDAASSSSTALSMAAFAAIGDAKTADEAYTMLAAYKTADGGYSAQAGGESDGAFSTVDALHGLEVYSAYQDSGLSVYILISIAVGAVAIIVLTVIMIVKKGKKVEKAQ